jgi:predicted RNA binding protein YcfA (HicA-like mRNA interferase family)
MSGLKQISGKQLIKALEKQSYFITRQKGSHVRLTKTDGNQTHHITIPEHSPLKIGTLHGILKDIANHLQISKNELISLLNL